MSNRIRKLSVICLCLALLAVGSGCDLIGPASPQMDPWGIRFFMAYTVGKGLALCWTAALTVPWITRATYRFPSSAVDFDGFDRPSYFDLHSKNFGSFGFETKPMGSFTQFVDFNGNGILDSNDALTEWNSSQNTFEFSYGAPYGSSSVFPAGTYSYQMPSDSFSLKASYFDYDVDLEFASGDPMTLHKFHINHGGVLPQIAFGRVGDLELSTRIDVGNPETEDAQAFLRFYSSGGSPWPVEINGMTASEHQLTVPGGKNLAITLSSEDSPAVGWALAYGDRNLGFNSSFTTLINGQLDAEAGFAAVLPTNYQLLGVERDRSLDLSTAFAVVNPTMHDATIQLTYENSIPPVTHDLMLPAMQQTAVFFDSIVSSSMEQLMGTMRFQSDTDFAVGSLRTVGGKQFSSLEGTMYRINF